eukprot:6045605-Pleurochrysis_carterae.AAC.1
MQTEPIRAEASNTSRAPCTCTSMHDHGFWSAHARALCSLSIIFFSKKAFTTPALPVRADGMHPDILLLDEDLDIHVLGARPWLQADAAAPKKNYEP